jgi:hypothetical protein
MMMMTRSNSNLPEPNDRAKNPEDRLFKYTLVHPSVLLKELENLRKDFHET